MGTTIVHISVFYNDTSEVICWQICSMTCVRTSQMYLAGIYHRSAGTWRPGPSWAPLCWRWLWHSVVTWVFYCSVSLIDVRYNGIGHDHPADMHTSLSLTHAPNELSTHVAVTVLFSLPLMFSFFCFSLATCLLFFSCFMHVIKCSFIFMDVIFTYAFGKWCEFITLHGCSSILCNNSVA